VLGRIAEFGSVMHIFEEPLHPYPELIGSIPIIRSTFGRIGRRR
jgi:ABC-type dipeptide/oligopeptide/nickel transport system ATPase component